MQRFHILVLVMVLMVAGVFFVQEQEKTATHFAESGELLYPGLKEKMKALQRFDVQGDHEGATIIKGEDGIWKVKEMFDYPASAKRVRQLLYRLGESKLKEGKTNNPKQYAALHLSDKLAKHLRVFAEGQDAPVVDLYIGKFSTGFGGTYVRRKGEDRVWLVSENLALEEAPVGWVEENLLSLERAEVREVVITRVKNDNLAIARDKPGDDFHMKDMPGGAKLTSVYDLNTMASAFENMTLQKVLHVSSVMGPKIQDVWVRSFDGLELHFELFLLDKAVWAKISARYSESARKEYLETAAKLPNAKELEKNLQAPDAVTKTADAINAKTAHWYYMLSNNVLQQLRKRQDDLLVNKDTEKPAEKK